MKKSGWINESQRGIKVIYGEVRGLGKETNYIREQKKHASQGGIFMRKG